MLKNGFIFILWGLLQFACSPKKKEIDLLLYGAKIYTVDSSFSIQSAMAVDHGRILETGEQEALMQKYQAREMLNAGGQTVWPGLIDAHCHFSGYATDKWKCDLRGTTSFNEVIERVKRYAQKGPMFWIYGRGWDQNDWKDNQFPDKSKLDELFPDRPVLLKRIDGHAALVNQYVLDKFGITAMTKVNGGSVELKNGKPSGMLIDNAMDLVDTQVPMPGDSLAKVYFKKAEEECFALGLTGVHDCGISEHTLELLEQEQRSGNLRMKIFALLNNDSLYYSKWLKNGVYQTDRLRMGGFKVYSDGALGSRGACLLQAYADKPGWKGFFLSDTAQLEKLAAAMSITNLQLCSHAIGDSANRYMLKLYARALKGKNTRRWRIEHAQVLNEADFHYFGDYDIIPSVQPTHATSDMYWAEKRLGSHRLKNAYAYKRLLQISGRIALGTDFPVEDISPVKTFYAAVYRKDSKAYPDSGFQKENALSPEEALRGMSIWAAYAAFEEHGKGSLETGKAADFILLDRDPATCPEKDVLGTRVLATYINGEKVYQNPQ
ncbi:MAG TPA: amidohydrolase [Bacteroidia bacterium]|nr:amidohydrolase [Bacteroidia bacterium]